MDSESLASDRDRTTRLARAQRTVDSSATRVKDALGSIIELAGVPTHANQPLWRRLDAFASADLKGVISGEAQADIAHHLRELSALQDRVAEMRWDVAAAPAESPGQDPVTGHGRSGTITTTLPAIELLADVVTAVAAALEYIHTRLTAQIMFDASLPGSVRAYVRDIRTMIARVSTQPDPAWTWETQPAS